MSSNHYATEIEDMSGVAIHSDDISQDISAEEQSPVCSDDDWVVTTNESIHEDELPILTEEIENYTSDQNHIQPTSLTIADTIEQISNVQLNTQVEKCQCSYCTSEIYDDDVHLNFDANMFSLHKIHNVHPVTNYNDTTLGAALAPIVDSGRTWGEFTAVMRKYFDEDDDENNPIIFSLSQTNEGYVSGLMQCLLGCCGSLSIFGIFALATQE